jgi:hypothetical protein
MVKPMTNREAFKIWAPDGVLWTEWAKPVLFASMTDMDSYIPEPTESPITDINWLGTTSKDTALIIDLPGEDGVAESLLLAEAGYRPVPLYNGVFEKNEFAAVVAVRDLVRALYIGANTLKKTLIRNDAPPVFMLDSLRMRGASKSPGTYDNRWCIFPQDMPSAAFLLKQGIRKVLVRTRADEISPTARIQDDVTHILRRYQDAGIKILHTNGINDIKATDVSTPSQFKSLFYRFQVILGLCRNSAGGFGGKIPDSMQSGSGGRYYGMG